MSDCGWLVKGKQKRTNWKMRGYGGGKQEGKDRREKIRLKGKGKNKGKSKTSEVENKYQTVDREGKKKKATKNRLKREVMVAGYRAGDLKLNEKTIKG